MAMTMNFNKVLTSVKALNLLSSRDLPQWMSSKNTLGWPLDVCIDMLKEGLEKGSRQSGYENWHEIDFIIQQN